MRNQDDWTSNNLTTHRDQNQSNKLNKSLRNGQGLIITTGKRNCGKVKFSVMSVLSVMWGVPLNGLIPNPTPCTAASSVKVFSLNDITNGINTITDI